MRLAGEPGSRDFLLSYAEAENMLKARHSGDTFNGLIREYTNSIEFETKLSAASQREYKRMLTKAEPEFGEPREALNDPAIRKELLDWRAKIARASGEREADNQLSVISAMLTWAVENGRLDVNNIRGFKRLYHSDRSEKIWLPEHIKSFMRVAPIELQPALIIALHTGHGRETFSASPGPLMMERQSRYGRARTPEAASRLPSSRFPARRPYSACWTACRAPDL